MTRYFSATAACFLLSLTAITAQASDKAAGRYRSTDNPDTASQIELTADGHFRYMLIEGALDEMAEGRWSREGSVIRLWTEPRPVPPRLSLDSMTPDGEAPLSIIVNAPGGQGIAGIDFRIELDAGEPLTGYTQAYGWQGGPPTGRTARYIQLYEPIHGIMSDRFAIAPGARTLRFTLTPNDLDIADFQGTEIYEEGDRLTLRHRLGDRHYVRVGG